MTLWAFFYPLPQCVSVFFSPCSVILLLALHLCLFTMIGMLLFAKTEVSSGAVTLALVKISAK